MATTYAEFDVTNQQLVPELITRILASTDWSRVTSASAPALYATNAVMGVGATTIPNVSGAATTAGVGIGSVLRIGPEGAADTEYRVVTATTATTVTLDRSTIYAHASGTNIYAGSTVLKSTSTDGAELIVDLTAGGFSVNFLAPSAYQAFASGVPSGITNRILYWRPSGGQQSNVMHGIVSAGKDHLFISVEGPRASEANPSSNSGSLRNYFFLSALTKYHAGDPVPTVVAGGCPLGASYQAGLSVGSHIAHVSRNYANNTSWSPARLLTLSFPGQSNYGGVNVNRQTDGDGDWYVAPYTVFEDNGGLRGRLSSFFNAGFTVADVSDMVAPPVGAVVTIDGAPYKLLAVNRGDGSSSGPSWGPFGAAVNTSNPWFNSVVVAVPTT